MHYAIERQTPGGGDGDWENAWGFKPRSFPKATDDDAAVAVFRRETARCRSPYRLVRWEGGGYAAERIVLARHPEQHPPA